MTKNKLIYKKLSEVLNKLIDAIDGEFDIGNSEEFEKLYLAALSLNIHELLRIIYEKKLDRNQSSGFVRTIFDAVNKGILTLYDKDFSKFIRQEYATNEAQRIEHIMAHDKRFKKTEELRNWAKKVKYFRKQTPTIDVDKYSPQKIINNVGNLISYEGWNNYYIGFIEIYQILEFIMASVFFNIILRRSMGN